MFAPKLEPAPILDHILELAQESKVNVGEVTKGEFLDTARSFAPQGVIALAEEIKPVALQDLVAPQQTLQPFLLALDGITDPGNLGAILRTAEAAGVTGVILRSHRATRITATVAKAAAGAVEHLQFALVPGLPAALKTLSDNNIWTVGLDAAGKTDIADLKLNNATALIIGDEGTGLSRLVAQRCDVVASIPMTGTLGSLNASAAAAIACFAIARQRKDNPRKDTNVN